jgi:alpha-glucosidase
VPDGQWYLHLFDSSQPDFDWRNPEVGDMFEEVLRFWLDRGVDGFRVDVAHGLFKEESLRDQVVPEGERQRGGADVNEQKSMVERTHRDEPMWDQPEVHEVYRRWHKVLEEYDGDRMTVAEAWTQTPESMARFVRDDEMSQSFNFTWLLASWSATAFADVITSTFEALQDVHADPTWVLSNHDVVRHVTRYGGGAQGLARARAATLTMLALPGSAYLYQGEELGLEQVDVPEDDRTDPTWLRTRDTDAPEIGRDGCRVPIPWSGSEPPYGFGPGTGQPWLPQPAGWGTLSVEAQEADPASTLAFYRRAIAARRTLLGAPGTVEILSGDSHGLGEDVLAFRRGDLTVLLNCGSSPVPLPEGEVVVASVELGAGDREIPGDTAVWLR